LPLVGEHRPSFVVAPVSGNLQVLWRVALAAHADRLCEPFGTNVFGPNVRFNSVQPEVEEGVFEQQT